MEAVEQDNENTPRRSLRLALSEINETAADQTSTPNKSANAEEILVKQRGPRRKPITWSPVEYDKLKILTSSEKTPEKTPPAKCEINPKLRRRLVMSPGKNSASQELGVAIAKKLRSLKMLDKTLTKSS